MRPYLKKLRMGMLLAGLVLASTAWVATAYATYLLESELREIADSNEDELTREYLQRDSRVIGADVTAANPFGLFQDTQGKVSIYVAIPWEHGERYYVYDYFYTRADDQWVFQSSGVCSDHECQIRATAMDRDTSEVI